MQEFNFGKHWTPWVKVSLAVSLLFLILGVLYPFYTTEDVPQYTPIFIALSSIIVWGGLSIYAWITLKKLPFTGIVVDQDGIWYKHLGKDRGLVLWHRIEKTKENNNLRCLDLLDADGKKLIRIQTTINNFNRLAKIIYENTAR